MSTPLHREAKTSRLIEFPSEKQQDRASAWGAILLLMCYLPAVICRLPDLPG